MTDASMEMADGRTVGYADILAPGDGHFSVLRHVPDLLPELV